MPRYQKIKPEFEDPQLTLAKRRVRLEKILQTVWVFLMLFGILTVAIGGKYAVLVGITALLMGAACLLLGGFLFYTLEKGWMPLLLQDEIEGMRGSKKEREAAQKEQRVLRVIECLVLAVMGLGFLVLGVLYLFGIL